MGTGKVLLSMTLGAILGSMATNFAKSEKGRKMKNDLYDSLHELGGDAENILSSAKSKAENVGHTLANKVTGKYNYAKGRVDEKMNNWSDNQNR